MMVQLVPAIPVDTVKGEGYAYAWTDYSQDHDRLWLVCLSSNGEWWDLPQSDIRGMKNISMERTGKQTPFKKHGR